MLESQANYSRFCERQREGMVSYHTETLSAFWAKIKEPIDECLYGGVESHAIWKVGGE